MPTSEPDAVSFFSQTQVAAMAIHRQRIAERIDWLFGLSREHAQEFCSPEAYLSRDRYLSQHTTSMEVTDQ